MIRKRTRPKVYREAREKRRKEQREQLTTKLYGPREFTQPFTMDFAEQVKLNRLLREGYVAKEIAWQFGININTCYAAIRKYQYA